MIEKEQVKDRLKPKDMESLEKMKSKALEDVKLITRTKYMSEIYVNPQVIDND